MRTLGQVTLPDEDYFPQSHIALYSCGTPDVKDKARGKDNHPTGIRIVYAVFGPGFEECR
jgi:hypothetical protein